TSRGSALAKHDLPTGTVNPVGRVSPKPTPVISSVQGGLFHIRFQAPDTGSPTTIRIPAKASSHIKRVSFGKA
ncbi:hypothetical protein, partial [Roseibacillus persicicus]|uniref:hypothetical protein n=1 Tax=Roseibacillus persicicus TaxID=454148 RepID=UPI00280CDFF4